MVSHWSLNILINFVLRVFGLLFANKSSKHLDIIICGTFKDKLKQFCQLSIFIDLTQISVSVMIVLCIRNCITIVPPELSLTVTDITSNETLHITGDWIHGYIDIVL